MDLLWNILETQDKDVIFKESIKYFKDNLKQNDDKFDPEYYVDYILEVISILERTNDFEKLFEFRNVLKHHNKEIYQSCFGYIDDGLVNYFCFKNEKTKVEECLSGFIANPVKFFDFYDNLFINIMFYKHTDILKQITKTNFEAINTSDKLFFEPEYTMALFYKNILLQEIFEKNVFNKNNFVQTIEKYNYDFEEPILDIFNEILTDDTINLVDCLDKIEHIRYYNVLKVELFFQKQMVSMGFPFYLSGWIFEKFQQFCSKNNKEEHFYEKFFEIDPNNLEHFLEDMVRTMMFDLRFLKYGLLWGFVYIYDFLFSNNLISEKYYKTITHKIKELKGKSIAISLNRLWSYDFVHQWKKPDSISDDEFNYEQNIFKKSISIEHQKFDLQVKHIEDDLSKMGELAHHILEYGKNMYSTYKSYSSSNNYKPNNVKTYTEPLKLDKKVGRNDLCPCGSGKKYKKCCINKTI